MSKKRFIFQKNFGQWQAAGAYVKRLMIDG